MEEVEVDIEVVRVEDTVEDHRLEVLLVVDTEVDHRLLRLRREDIAVVLVEEVEGATVEDHPLEVLLVVDTEVDHRLLRLRREDIEVEVRVPQRGEMSEDIVSELVDHRLEVLLGVAIAEVQVVEVAGVTVVLLHHLEHLEVEDTVEGLRLERILLVVGIADHHREATGRMIGITRVVLLERMTVDDMLDRVRVNKSKRILVILFFLFLQHDFFLDFGAYFSILFPCRKNYSYEK